ncbi:replication protein A 70 kDa DNA-binding subunit A [Striga asiatica]|uniref:Replication protein A 70 kDa DNA-binding subunit A n=1 Tax=Striga asiatica TaxID=4170 RepID=A0A5A7QBX6_STRAF|nr:replication protein A 70 kDa DNA-binding subunit A [Striga asiatica]
MHKASWDNLARDKEEEGLVLRDLSDFNEALLVKGFYSWLWRCWLWARMSLNLRRLESDIVMEARAKWLVFIDLYDALNIYQGRWTIKARVTSKDELRHYNNPRGDGKVFSFDLLDSNGGEIRVTCFNSVADQFYDQIEPGRVYMISRGTLKHSQKAFNHLHNDHEIMFDSTSTVQPCFDDDNILNILKI